MNHVTPCCFKPESQEQAERIVKELEKRGVEKLNYTIEHYKADFCLFARQKIWGFCKVGSITFQYCTEATTESEFLAMASMTDDPNARVGAWCIASVEGKEDEWYRPGIEMPFMGIGDRKATLEEIREKFGRKEEPENDYYCAEWNNVGYICEDGQCTACLKAESLSDEYGTISEGAKGQVSKDEVFNKMKEALRLICSIQSTPEDQSKGIRMGRDLLKTSKP